MCALWFTLLILAPQCSDGSRMNVAKKVKNEPPLEQWEKELCIVLQAQPPILKGMPPHLHAPGTSSDAAKCRAAMAVEDAYRQEKEKLRIGALTHADFDSRCKSYKQEKAKIQTEVEERVPGGTIRAAAEFCEPEVKQVCITNLCPTMCFIKDQKDCDCEQMCEDTASQMWKTGSMDCKDKKFSECQEDLDKELKLLGRNKPLEALMREHTVKCMCVSWRKPDTRDICYQGGKGIKRGTKWCEFTDTGSWTQMLDTYDATKEKQKALPKVECDEFPATTAGMVRDNANRCKAQCDAKKSWWKSR